MPAAAIDWSLAREAAIWFVKGRQVDRVNIVRSDAESWRGGLAGIEPCTDTLWKRLCATSVDCCRHRWTQRCPENKCLLQNNKINQRALRTGGAGYPGFPWDSRKASSSFCRNWLYFFCTCWILSCSSFSRIVKKFWSSGMEKASHCEAGRRRKQGEMVRC